MKKRLRVKTSIVTPKNQWRKRNKQLRIPRSTSFKNKNKIVFKRST